MTLQRSILLDTLKGKPAHRPPFWFMRQAGRVLPSYQKLREKFSFWDLMRDPQRMAEVTLLPLNDLGVDAAILFSDILVIPYAMGMSLDFTNQGPVFNTPLISKSDPLKALLQDGSKLNYIYQGIDCIMDAKPDHIPLIGFCGAPLTVLCYMLQGRSNNSYFPDAVQYLYQQKGNAKRLIDAVTEFSIEYARQQVSHGVEVFQLFETHAGLIPFEHYTELFMPSVRRIAQAMRDKNIPFIFFPRGLGMGISQIKPDDCDYLGIDWQTPLPLARKWVEPSIGLQGNLDPRILLADRGTLLDRFAAYLDFGSKNTNWIFNLGHGFLPDTPFESARYLSDWIRESDWKRNP